MGKRVLTLSEPVGWSPSERGHLKGKENLDRAIEVWGGVG